MISTDMNQALNGQLEMEGYASFLYLSMASWCDAKGLQGCKAFFLRQSQEENMHMMKMFEYILEMNGKAIVPAINKPPMEFDSIKKIFEDTYAHEQKVTKAISRLVDLAIKDNDHSTHNFLQWYVEEQREEEALIRDVLDKIELIGDGPMSLYYIDKEIEIINNNQPNPA